MPSKFNSLAIEKYECNNILEILYFLHIFLKTIAIFLILIPLLTLKQAISISLLDFNTFSKIVEKYPIS